MDSFGLIHHPLDRFSLTGSMADLDARGMDAADQLMTMIGDLHCCNEDIRGTCARYFCFIDTLWLLHLCDSAHLDYVKVRAYLRDTENEAASELDNTVDDAQAAFDFPEIEDQPAGPINDAPGTLSELPCANNKPTDSHTDGWGSSIQKPPPKGNQALDSEGLGNRVARRKA
jgi:hypothetical protein